MAAPQAVRTPRLVLEPFGPEYLTPVYVGWLNDPATMAYSEQRHRTHTLESCAAYMRSFDGAPGCFWAVTLAGNGRHVGNVSAAVDEHNALANVSIMIGDGAGRGQGLGTEAFIGVCDWLLRVRGLRKVEAGTMDANEAMKAVARKAGMVEDGRRRAHYLLHGEPVDIVHFALFRERWIELHPHGPWGTTA